MAIVVGGVAIAAGIALYEHEPFREWCDETWKTTADKWEDLVDKVGKRERRREVPMGAAKPTRDNTADVELKRRRSSAAMKRSTASIDDALQMAQDAESILFEGRSTRDARFGSVRRRRGNGSICRDTFVDTQKVHGSVASVTTVSTGLHTPTSESGASMAHSEDYWGTHTLDAHEVDIMQPLISDESRTAQKSIPGPLNSNPISVDAISRGSTPLTAKALHAIAHEPARPRNSENYTVNKPASFYSIDQDEDVVSNASSKTLSHVSVNERMLRTPNSSMVGGEERDDVLSIASSGGWSEISGQSGAEH